MNTKRTLTEEEIALALEMRAHGKGIEPIARKLKCGRALVYNTLKEIGDPFVRHHNGRRTPETKEENARDPITAYPIGQVPKGHPLYEADQQMLRARQMRHRAEGWIRSSMGWD
jgi:hypothetical protein